MFKRCNVQIEYQSPAVVVEDSVVSGSLSFMGQEVLLEASLKHQPEQTADCSIIEPVVVFGVANGEIDASGGVLKVHNMSRAILEICFDTKGTDIVLSGCSGVMPRLKRCLLEVFSPTSGDKLINIGGKDILLKDVPPQGGQSLP